MSIYAFSDIHGNRKLFNQVMASINSNDTIYFLGDAIDRGPDGWNILKELLNDPRVIFIKGNHEDMMSNALLRYPNYPYSRALEIWNWNGNEPTLEAINNEDENVVKEILKKIKSLPTKTIYNSPSGNIFWLSHAGCNWHEEGIESITDYDLIWDRNHFYPNESEDNIPNNLYIVHGHTPIVHLVEQLSWFKNYQYLPEEMEPGAFYYAEGHKIDIDCGAHFTGTTVLLNLDTFEEKIFKEDEF